MARLDRAIHLCGAPGRQMDRPIKSGDDVYGIGYAGEIRLIPALAVKFFHAH
jgi:hypothetical protein